MRQTFDETTDRSFGPKHLPRVRERMAAQGLDGFSCRTRMSIRTSTCPGAKRPAAGSPVSPIAGAAVVLKDKAAVFASRALHPQVRDQWMSVFEICDLMDGGVPPIGKRDATRRGDRLAIRNCTHPMRCIGCAPLRKKRAQR